MIVSVPLARPRLALTSEGSQGPDDTEPPGAASKERIMSVFGEAVAHPFLVRALDRCDRCGAEAYVRVVVTASRLPLLFCAHHYSDNTAELSRVAVVTHDERALVLSGWSSKSDAI
jgi:hypothetical protein